MAVTSEPEFYPETYCPAPPTYLITSHLHTIGFFQTCPRAQTLEAYSSLFKCTVWIPLPCKQWRCPFCANIKVNTLARKCEAANPNRLLTLTVDPSLWTTPRDAFDGTRRQVSELIKKLRPRFGEVEYLRVTELTRGGWPHYHMLLRSQFLPQPVVKSLWTELTGAQIVDLRKVHNKFQTFKYLVKYLTKMHTIAWTERHVSYSKAFFPKPPETDKPDIGLLEPKVIETHPGTLVYHQFRNAEIAEIAYNVFTLNPSRELKDSISEPTPFNYPPPRNETEEPGMKEENPASSPIVQKPLFEKTPSPV